MSSKEPRPLPTHTPGPWKIGPAQWRRGGPPYKIPISGQHGTIANVLTHEAIRREGWGNRPPEQPNADALLIARAPELLARVAELEQALTIDGIEDLIKTRDRLRELLQRCHHQLHSLVCVFVSDQDGAHKETCDLMRTIRDQLGMSHHQDKP